MCKIYEFPKPITIPKRLEECLQESARGYVRVLTDILEYFEDENFTDEDLLKVVDVILVTYLQTIESAIDEL